MKACFKLYISYFALALFAGAFSGCTEDTYNFDNLDESISIKYEMALPLVQSTFAIEDAFNEHNDDIELKENEDGLLYLEYTTDIEFKDLPEFEVASIDYFSFKQSDTDIPDPIPLSSTPFEVSRTNKIVLSAGTGGLDTVYISRGSFGINMQSGFINTGSVIEAFEITVDNMTKGGNPLVAEFDPNDSDTATIDVSGYTIVIDQNSGEESIPINVTYKLSSSTPSSTTLEQEAWLKIDFSNDLGLNMIVGELDKTILVQETLDVELSIFDDDYFSKDEIEFYDPKIFLDIKNYFGVPISMKFDNAKLANPAANESGSLTLDINDNLEPAAITRTGNDNSFTVTPSEKIIELNKDSIPELTTLLKGIYSHLFLDANIAIDPSYSGPVYFNPDSGSVGLSLITHLPFWVKLNNVSYEEEVDFDMGSIYEDAGEDSLNIDKLEEAYIEIIISNSYAFEAEIQCYLLDNNKAVVDSLFSDGPTEIEGAASKENKDDNVKAVESTIKIELNGEKARNWRKVKTARIEFGATTVGNEFQKFFADDEMSVKLGVHVKKGVYEKEEF